MLTAKTPTLAHRQHTCTHSTHSYNKDRNWHILSQKLPLKHKYGYTKTKSRTKYLTHTHKQTYTGNRWTQTFLFFWYIIVVGIYIFLLHRVLTQRRNCFWYMCLTICACLRTSFSLLPLYIYLLERRMSVYACVYKLMWRHRFISTLSTLLSSVYGCVLTWCSLDREANRFTLKRRMHSTIRGSLNHVP